MLNFCRNRLLDIRLLSAFLISVFFMLIFGLGTANELKGKTRSEQNFAARCAAGNIAIASTSIVSLNTACKNFAPDDFGFPPASRKVFTVSLNLINSNIAITTN